MINPKNKRVTITLDPISQELLTTLAQRYNKSFSDIFKWSLNVLAAKKRHNLVIKLREQIESKEPDKETIENHKWYDKDGNEITYDQWLELYFN